MRKAILAVGAHPDDIELGCGATIAKHIEKGDIVYVMILTNGECGQHPQNREECRRSLGILGIKESNIIFGSFPDGSVSDNRETVSFIEEHIKRLNINKVYSHHPKDRHQDHRNCSNAVSSAARKVAEILLYKSPSTHLSFEPHYFVEVSEKHLKTKFEALSCYETQIRKGCVNLRALKSLAELNGIACNTEFAEAFDVNHIFRGKEDV